MPSYHVTVPVVCDVASRVVSAACRRGAHAPRRRRRVARWRQVAPLAPVAPPPAAGPRPPAEGGGVGGVLHPRRRCIAAVHRAVLSSRLCASGEREVDVSMREPKWLSNKAGFEWFSGFNRP